MEKFDFDDPQATAIVNFQLGQLAGLEIEKIVNELDELDKKLPITKISLNMRKEFSLSSRKSQRK